MFDKQAGAGTHSACNLTLFRNYLKKQGNDVEEARVSFSCIHFHPTAVETTNDTTAGLLLNPFLRQRRERLRTEKTHSLDVCRKQNSISAEYEMRGVFQTFSVTEVF